MAAVVDLRETAVLDAVLEACDRKLRRVRNPDRRQRLETVREKLKAQRVLDLCLPLADLPDRLLPPPPPDAPSSES